MANKSNNKNSKSNKTPTKSNKTAHVLNLLAGDSHEAAPKRQSHVAQSAGAPAPMAPPPTAAENEAVAESIRSALEEDLLAELEAEPVQAPAPVPVEEDFQPFQPPAAEAIPAPVEAAPPQPEPQPAPVEAAPPQPEPQPAPVEAAPPQPEPQPAPVEAAPPQPEPQPAPVEAAPPQPEPQSPEQHDRMEEVTYLNVMQALVEDRVDKLMERFHMCTCPRCRTDVVALTLSSLPAKYIVVPESEGIPMLSVYEGRYEAAVTAQLMWACQKVSAHPRHAANSDGSMRLGAPRKSDG
ncbi:late competence development ComFB family protein [Acutalibacter sp.]|jgi:hypothetical protein|uniref:late competence development ComFB family protein n=1 Tax=Acutalibacter sp. TaxID=1918636 RepID=UPI00217489C5|nr:late competence development ComFB family protein [Acutalibacter sp.]